MHIWERLATGHTLVEVSFKKCLLTFFSIVFATRSGGIDILSLEICSSDVHRCHVSFSLREKMWPTQITSREGHGSGSVL